MTRTALLLLLASWLFDAVSTGSMHVSQRPGTSQPTHRTQGPAIGLLLAGKCGVSGQFDTRLRLQREVERVKGGGGDGDSMRDDTTPMKVTPSMTSKPFVSTWKSVGRRNKGVEQMPDLGFDVEDEEGEKDIRENKASAVYNDIFKGTIFDGIDWNEDQEESPDNDREMTFLGEDMVAERGDDEEGNLVKQFWEGAGSGGAEDKDGKQGVKGKVGKDDDENNYFDEKDNFKPDFEGGAKVRGSAGRVDGAVATGTEESLQDVVIRLRTEGKSAAAQTASLDAEEGLRTAAGVEGSNASHGDGNVNFGDGNVHFGDGDVNAGKEEEGALLKMKLQQANKEIARLQSQLAVFTNPTGLFFEEGVLLNVPIHLLSGWTECYSAPYWHYMTWKHLDTEEMGTLVMLAARLQNSSTLALAAIGRRSVVFPEDVFSEEPRLENGVYFYRYWNAVGFSDTDDIMLNDCDVAQPENEKKLSWFVDVSWGGYRAGRHLDLWNEGTKWEKVIYTA